MLRSVEFAFLLLSSDDDVDEMVDVPFLDDNCVGRGILFGRERKKNEPFKATEPEDDDFLTTIRRFLYARHAP